MLPAILCIFAAVIFRLAIAFTGSNHDIGAWNFAPVAAIALCGGIFLPRRLAVILPLAILFASDVLLNLHYRVPLLDVQMLARYVALALTVGLGLCLRQSRKAPLILLGSVAGSVLFYVLTNTGSWFTAPEYAKTFAGWFQALTTGVPGWPPTIVFFRNTVISDLVFTIVFLACQAWTTRETRSRDGVTAPSGAHS